MTSELTTKLGVPVGQVSYLYNLSFMIYQGWDIYAPTSVK